MEYEMELKRILYEENEKNKNEQKLREEERFRKKFLFNIFNLN